jgi:PEP-CTERM motif
MKKLVKTLAFAVGLSIAPTVKAVVTIGHVENATVGSFLTSGGLGIPVGGVSVGFFTSNPTDAAFGTTINSWADLLAAGYTDVRSIPGASMTAGFDWDYPIPIGGSEINIPIASLPAGTQLYVAAFNAGTYNLATPASSFGGATEWAIVKDTSNLSPADNGTKSILLNTAVGPEILTGTDNGVNVNMTSLGAGPIPEPSRMVLLCLGGMGLLFRRRRC